MYENLINLQPNRKPFLFIEEIIECIAEKSAITTKYLDNWPSSGS